MCLRLYLFYRFQYAEHEYAIRLRRNRLKVNMHLKIVKFKCRLFKAFACL